MMKIEEAGQMKKGSDSRLTEELRLFSDEISQQIAEKCVELDRKYHLGSDSMEGYFVYCIFKHCLDLPVAKRLARLEMEREK